MKKIRLILLAMSVGLIAACSTTPRSPAPVVERTAGTRPAGAAKSVQKQGEERGYYTVKKGDTLIHIALEVGQNYRDLVAWNNLANANDIRVDQTLRVLPPESGAAPGAPQTGSIVANSGVEVRPLSAAPTPVSVAVVPLPGPLAATAGNKSWPRADKRPYSDAALAELQKPDPGPAAAVTAKLSDTRTPEKTIETPAAASDEEAVAWMWPAEGKVVATFDEGKKGIDITGKSGQQVLAAGAGKVMYAGSGIRGYGNLVIVKHTNTLLSAYAHNKTILVKEGQSVSRGQKIAEMGNSDSDVVKLHFEIRRQGKPVDPSRFLPAK